MSGGTASTTAWLASIAMLSSAKFSAEIRPEPDCRAAMLQKTQRRVDKGAAETVLRHQRPARQTTGSERLPDHRGREFRRRFTRLDIEHREKQRPQQAVPQRAIAAHGLRH